MLVRLLNIEVEKNGKVEQPVHTSEQHNLHHSSLKSLLQ